MMRQIHWGIGLIIGLIALLCIFPRTEGFSVAYDECRTKGFSKSFCVQTPVSTYGPSHCLCSDGRLGRILPGFQGECHCPSLGVNNQAALAAVF